MYFKDLLEGRNPTPNPTPKQHNGTANGTSLLAKYDINSESLTDNHRLSLIPPGLSLYYNNGELNLSSCTYAEIASSDKFFNLASSFFADNGKVTCWKIKYSISTDYDEEKREEQQNHVFLTMGHGVHFI